MVLPAMTQRDRELRQLYPYVLQSVFGQLSRVGEKETGICQRSNNVAGRGREDNRPRSLWLTHITYPATAELNRPISRNDTSLVQRDLIMFLGHNARFPTASPPQLHATVAANPSLQERSWRVFLPVRLARLSHSYDGAPDELVESAYLIRENVSYAVTFFRPAEPAVSVDIVCVRVSVWYCTMCVSQVVRRTRTPCLRHACMICTRASLLSITPACLQSKKAPAPLVGKRARSLPRSNAFSPLFTQPTDAVACCARDALQDIAKQL